MVEQVEQEAELPLEGPGVRLARAREAAGLTRSEIAARTRIAERQLIAIEEGRWGDLPSRTYALGFARSYAKAVGLDGNDLAQAVRAELDRLEPAAPSRPAQVFEPGDPARLPGSKVAWLAAGGLVAVLIAGLIFWPSLFAPGGSLPSILKEPAPAPVAVTTPPPAPADGPVVFTATRDKVWVRFADASGRQLLQKELAMGESWTVPAGVEGVTLTTARPDGLAITIAGRAVPPLSTTEQTMRDVPVTGAALLARGTASAAPVSTPTAAVATNEPLARPQRPAARPARPLPEVVPSATASPAASPEPSAPACPLPTADS